MSQPQTETPTTPSQRSGRPPSADTDPTSLKEIDNAIERIKRCTQQAPYFLTTPSDRPYRTTPAMLSSIYTTTPFGQTEEDLQYATFLYREPGSLFVLETAYEDEAKRKEKLLNADGAGSKPNTPLHSSTAKKKISLSAYKQARLHGQGQTRDNAESGEDHSSASHAPAEAVTSTTTQPTVATTHNNSKDLHDQNSAKTDKNAVAKQHESQSTPSSVMKPKPESSNPSAAPKQSRPTFESPNKRIKLSPEAGRVSEPRSVAEDKSQNVNKTTANTQRRQEQASQTTNIRPPKVAATVRKDNASPLIPKVSLNSPKSNSKTMARSATNAPNKDDMDSSQNSLPSWLPDKSIAKTSPSTVAPTKELLKTLPPWIPSAIKSLSRLKLPPVLDESGHVEGFASPTGKYHSSSSQSEPLMNHAAASPLHQIKKKQTKTQPVNHRQTSPAPSKSKDLQGVANGGPRAGQGRLHKPTPATETKLNKSQAADTLPEKSNHAATTLKPSAPQIRTVKVPVYPSKVAGKTTKAAPKVSAQEKPKEREEQKVVMLKYGKDKVESVEGILDSKRGHGKTGIAAHTNGSVHPQGVSSSSKTSVKRSLDIDGPSTEKVPAKRPKTGVSSTINSPRTPQQSVSKSPLTATPSTTQSKHTAAASGGSNPYTTHAIQLRDAGRRLKRQMQSYINGSAATALSTAGSEDKAKLAAIQGIESILCYIADFTCQEHGKQHLPDPAANWRSLIPLALEVCHACEHFTHLHGFALYLHSVCCQMLVSSHTRMKPETLAQDSPRLLKEILRYQERGSRLSAEAAAKLSRKAMAKQYPLAFATTQSLPLGMAVKPMTVVRAGTAFLQEWTKKEKLAWKPSVDPDDGVCAELS